MAAKYFREESLVLDIGSNVGHFCLCLARYFHDKGIVTVNVHAFEPNPAIFNRLKNNLLVNSSWHPKVALHELAIANENKEASFSFGSTNSGASRLTDSAHESARVEMMRLDSFYEKSNFRKRISFMKIDVEGFEPEVFEGGWSLITKHRPVLFFEISPDWCRERGVDAIQILFKLENIQYDLFYEKDNQLIAVKKDFGLIDKIYQTNILAIPQTILSDE
jgi:FkbM family methyltransferase